MNIVSVQTDEQLEKCFTVRKRVFVEEQEVPEDLEIDEFDASPEACRHMLVEVEGEPIAAGRWRFYEGRTVKMQRVAVLANQRGRGMGRMLMEAMERAAKNEGAEASVLDAQTHAEAFYRKLGYRVISTEPFLDAGIPHVRMKKEL